ncbi:alcohol dehydrogenase [Penicillium cataractarum]|uniref:Alcohol dehydrogenase n=1 Tax=Penicillium cataractarum TaxID=2100454 RepID=A0A9W9S2P8_9EURO|nr:alcohol dehydrogenase [Penicillium cataractarum]KAJ5370881.1 alcohol dehydrogenase [Penicillium cataractarum]
MADIQNQAAWLPYAKATPLQVGPAPKPSPLPTEVVIKVAYTAINLVDYGMQASPNFQLPYPFVLGQDVAGTIVEVGSNVNTLKVGQRVIGYVTHPVSKLEHCLTKSNRHCHGLLSGKAANSGFQLYSACLEILVAAIPDSLPFSSAVVLPLSISTAASSLYVQLQLPLPSFSPRPLGKKILLWGGSSSVGCSTIQLAVASGLEVVTTASEANHALVKSLGAAQVLDYKSPKIIDDLVNILNENDFVVDCISSPETQAQCGEVLSRIGGGKLPVMRFPDGNFPDNVKAVFVNGGDPGLVNLDVGNAIWGEYIPTVLATGQFQVKPDPFIIGGGLEKIQDGIDLLAKGVSAKKIVVEVSED